MNNRPTRNNPDAIIDALIERMNEYEEALFVIGELATLSFEDTIVGIVNSLDVPKMSEEEFKKYLKEIKEQKK